MVKNPLTNSGDARDADSIPVLGRPPGGGHGNPLQYSCLEISVGRGAWRATVHAPAESDMTEGLRTAQEVWEVLKDRRQCREADSS